MYILPVTPTYRLPYTLTLDTSGELLYTHEIFSRCHRGFLGVILGTHLGRGNGRWDSYVSQISFSSVSRFPPLIRSETSDVLPVKVPLIVPLSLRFSVLSSGTVRFRTSTTGETTPTPLTPLTGEESRKDVFGTGEVGGLRVVVRTLRLCHRRPRCVERSTGLLHRYSPTTTSKYCSRSLVVHSTDLRPVSENRRESS